MASMFSPLRFWSSEITCCTQLVGGRLADTQEGAVSIVSRNTGVSYLLVVHAGFVLSVRPTLETGSLQQRTGVCSSRRVVDNVCWCAQTCAFTFTKRLCVLQLSKMMYLASDFAISACKPHCARRIQ